MVFNDIHAEQNLIRTLSAMVPLEAGELVFLNGDMVNSASSEYQMCKEVFKLYADYFAHNMPMVFVRGNHEMRESFAQHLLKYILTNSGRFFHCFRYGSVHFTVLDSGNHVMDANDVTSPGLSQFTPYRQEQAAWLAQVIQTPAFKNARYRIVLSHIPLGRSAVGPELDTLWRELLNSGSIDLMICGHTEGYERHDPGDKYNFTTIIGGGPDLEVGGEATAITVRVSAEKLSISIRRSDRSLVEEFAIPVK